MFTTWPRIIRRWSNCCFSFYRHRHRHIGNWLPLSLFLQSSSSTKRKKKKKKKIDAMTLMISCRVPCAGRRSITKIIIITSAHKSKRRRRRRRRRRKEMIIKIRREKKERKKQSAGLTVGRSGAGKRCLVAVWFDRELILSSHRIRCVAVAVVSHRNSPTTQLTYGMNR